MNPDIQSIGPEFRSISSGDITLHLIKDDNLGEVYGMFTGWPDSDELIAEIKAHYLPDYEDGIRIKYGFYATLNGTLGGLSLLGVSSWTEKIGFTGADTLLHMRGKGIAPRSKPHLFYLAFEMLGLNRVESGCLVSNIASKRSIEKTPGFQFEGVSRESGLNDNGEFEDQYLYSILRKDYVKLYSAEVFTVA